METTIDVIRSKIRTNNEPGSYIVSEYGVIEKNLNDEAMKKREEKKSVDIAPEETEIENKTEE